MSFGISKQQTDWIGAPYIKKPPGSTARSVGYEAVMYRIFGPDPIWFDTSVVVRFGSKGNDLESVVYAYLTPAPPPDILTPSEWKLAGPFVCTDEEDFRKPEWTDRPPDTWPETWTADFGPYLADGSEATFRLPVHTPSEHGWCDFARHFRGRQRTNNGTQPSDVSAYAIGAVHIAGAGPHTLRIGFDDWLTLWIDEEQIYTGKHDAGFKIEEIPVDLPSGNVEIRIKLSNRNNAQWRLWAFSLVVDP